MTSDDFFRPHPSKVARSFQIAFCGNPKCGPHILALDDNDQVMSEIVMSPVQAVNSIEVIQKNLYAKAVNKE